MNFSAQARYSDGDIFVIGTLTLDAAPTTAYRMQVRYTAYPDGVLNFIFDLSSTENVLSANATIPSMTDGMVYWAATVQAENADGTWYDTAYTDSGSVRAGFSPYTIRYCTISYDYVGLPVSAGLMDGVYFVLFDRFTSTPPAVIDTSLSVLTAPARPDLLFKYYTIENESDNERYAQGETKPFSYRNAQNYTAVSAWKHRYDAFIKYGGSFREVQSYIKSGGTWNEWNPYI